MKRPSTKVVKRVACGAMVAAAIGCCLFTTMGQSSYDAEYKANENAISKLEDEVSRLENQKAASAEEINRDLYSASNAGREVASLQSAYQNIDASANLDGIKENAEKLSKYFEDDAQTGRVPWFTVTKGDGKAVWEFESNYSFTSESISVIWTCHLDGQNDVLAYATGDYNAKTEKFSSVEYKVTQVGMNYVDATAESDYKSKIDEVIKKIQEQSGGDAGMSAEDAQNQNDAREWLKDQNQKKNGGDD